VDDKYLYFLSGNNKQTHDIWKYNIKISSLEQITAGGFYNFDIAVSTTNKLAFSSNRTGNYEIWTQTESGYSKLTDNRDLDGRPTWSNDNTSIYFESTRDGNVNIWKKSLDSNALPIKITNHENGARYPLVRPK
jgi:Tol biopolymer transport system component